MRFSEETDKLFPALIAAWALIPTASKDAKNPHLKNDYATLSSLVDAAKPVLAAHKLAILQPVTYQLINADTNITRPVVETYIVHESGQWCMSPLSMDSLDGKPQTIGSTITYIRRYALGGMLSMIAEKDDDGNAGSNVNGPRNTYQQPTPPRAPQQAVTATVTGPDSPVKATRNKVMEVSGCDLNTIKIFFQGIWPTGAPKDSNAYLKPLEDLLNYVSRGSREIASLKSNPEKLGQDWVVAHRSEDDTVKQTEGVDIQSLADEIAKKRGIGTGLILLKTIEKLFAGVTNYKTDESLAAFLHWYGEEADAFEQLKASAKLGVSLTELVKRD